MLRVNKENRGTFEAALTEAGHLEASYHCTSVMTPRLPLLPRAPPQQNTSIITHNTSLHRFGTCDFVGGVLVPITRLSARALTRRRAALPFLLLTGPFSYSPHLVSLLLLFLVWEQRRGDKLLGIINGHYNAFLLDARYFWNENFKFSSFDFHFIFQ